MIGIPICFNYLFSISFLFKKRNESATTFDITASQTKQWSVNKTKNPLVKRNNELICFGYKGLAVIDSLFFFGSFLSSCICYYTFLFVEKIQKEGELCMKNQYGI